MARRPAVNSLHRACNFRRQCRIFLHFLTDKHGVRILVSRPTIPIFPRLQRHLSDAPSARNGMFMRRDSPTGARVRPGRQLPSTSTTHLRPSTMKDRVARRHWACFAPTTSTAGDHRPSGDVSGSAARNRDVNRDHPRPSTNRPSTTANISETAVGDRDPSARAGWRSVIQ